MLELLKKEFGLNNPKKFIGEQNGTMGSTFRGWFYNYEISYDKERTKLETDVALAVLTGNTAEAERLRLLLEVHPIEYQFTFRLVEEIPYVQGTKSLLYKGAKQYAEMEEVKEFIIRESLLTAENEHLMKFVEIPNTLEKQVGGSEVPLFNLTLSAVQIEIKEAIYNFNGELFLPKHAYLSQVSASLLQVAARMSNIQKNQESKLKGYRK